MQASKDRPIRVLFAEDALDQALLVKAFLQSAPAVFQITHSQDGDHAAGRAVGARRNRPRWPR